MPLIHTQTPETATGEVAEIYAQVKAAIGSVPTALQLMSASPIWLKQQVESIGYLMNHPNLSFATLAAIRMLVSMETKCTYCIDRNATWLIERAEWTPEQVVATKQNIDNAPLDARDKAMVKFAVQAVKDPRSVTQADVDALRTLGWSDVDIFDAANQAARMVAGDILFDAFKIERDF